MTVFLVIVAVILLGSLQYHADVSRIQEDYERWKRNRK